MGRLNKYQGGDNGEAIQGPYGCNRSKQVIEFDWLKYKGDVMESKTRNMTQEELRQEIEGLNPEYLITKAEKIVSELCRSGGKTWTLRVPAQADDPDMILSEVIRRLKEYEVKNGNFDESKVDCYVY